MSFSTSFKSSTDVWKYAAYLTAAQSLCLPSFTSQATNSAISGPSSSAPSFAYSSALSFPSAIYFWIIGHFDSLFRLHSHLNYLVSYVPQLLPYQGPPICLIVIPRICKEFLVFQRLFNPQIVCVNHCFCYFLVTEFLKTMPANSFLKHFFAHHAALASCRTLHTMAPLVSPNRVNYCPRARCIPACNASEWSIDRHIHPVDIKDAFPPF